MDFIVFAILINVHVVFNIEHLIPWKLFIDM